MMTRMVEPALLGEAPATIRRREKRKRSFTGGQRKGAQLGTPGRRATERPRHAPMSVASDCAGRRGGLLDQVTTGGGSTRRKELKIETQRADEVDPCFSRVAKNGKSLRCSIAIRAPVAVVARRHPRVWPEYTLPPRDHGRLHLGRGRLLERRPRRAGVARQQRRRDQKSEPPHPESPAAPPRRGRAGRFRAPTRENSRGAERGA